MQSLDFLYALARSTQKSEKQNSIRYMPFIALTMVLFGFFHAALVLIVEVPGVGEILLRSSGIAEMDWGFALAALLASVTTWLGFDRRREEIDLAFPFISPSSSDVIRLGVGLLTIGGGFALLALSIDRPVLTIGLYLFVMFVGPFILR